MGYVINGRLPDKLLFPVHGGRLAGGAAGSWNALCNKVYRDLGKTLAVNDTYRPLGARGDLARGVWSQWAAWERYQAGGPLAAQPGTSNHGWGLAVDTGDYGLVERYGAPFGWQKRWSDAPTEPWHFRWSSKHCDRQLVRRWLLAGPFGKAPEARVGDVLRRGDRGPGVRVLQQRLRKAGYYRGLANGRFGPVTEKWVKRFQARKGLRADGVVGSATWGVLR